MTAFTLDPITIPVSQQEQLQELQKLMQRGGNASLVGKGGEPALELPDVVYSLLLRILQGMQEGKAISIVPMMQDLTTQEAANFLGVSRPFFVKLLETGKLHYHMTGTHRRVYLKDLMDDRQYRDQDKIDAINRLLNLKRMPGCTIKCCSRTNNAWLPSHSGLLCSCKRGTPRYAATHRGAASSLPGEASESGFNGIAGCHGILLIG
jgi:excisionase family DNA binding protein